MLAQLQSVDADHLKNFALIVAGLSATAYYIRAWFPRKGETREILPSPLKVEGPEKLMTLDVMRAEFRSDIGELHDKVNAVGREVSELKASGAILQHQMERLDEKFDAVLKRRSS